MSRSVCVAVVAIGLAAPSCATIITVSQQNDQTLSGTTYYQMVVNNGDRPMRASGFETTTTFNSSTYAFSLTNYNTALMTMISATLDLERLVSSTSFAWTVSPDPGSSWRPHAYSPAESYTFLTVAAQGGSGASHSFALGPNTPISGYNLLALFGSDINANIPLLITWQQSFTMGACYDGSCGGVAYRKHWEGDPHGRLYDLSLRGDLHTWIEARMTLDDGVPESTTFLLMGSGLLALGLLGRRFRRNS